MIIVIRFKYVIFYLVSLVLLLILLFGRVVMVSKMADGSIRAVLISFLPLRTKLAPAAFRVASADPRQTFRLNYARSRLFKVAVRLQERRFPKGSPVTVRLVNLPTWLPGITRSFRRTLLPKIKPAILQGPRKRAGTREAIVVVFNTPLRQLGLLHAIQTNFSAKLAPNRYWWRGRLYTDYATWRIIPTKPLQHQTSYRISLLPGLTGIGGQKTSGRQCFSFTTVAPLKAIGQNPANGCSGFRHFAPLQLLTDRHLRQGRVDLIGYKGETVIHGSKLSYYPTPVLLPDTAYLARVRITDCFGETFTGQWRFRTAKLAGSLWAEVNLRLPQTIRVYLGKKVIKVIPVSGPAPHNTALRGGFRVAKRGYAFYSQKLQEGAYYWLQLANGCLIHSVIFGYDGRIKPGSITGLGQPGGNGSIQVELEDIKWLYRNLPQETPVIIHGPPGLNGSVSQENRYSQAVFFSYRAEFDRFMSHISGRTGVVR